ncbi:cytochrome c oxidase subunit 4 [Streptomyces sp. HC44]|uniref:cytochrome-c oxidase n=1 Tax=Streptomyces scabichelini TaxID=2711217 RepID=A0A6G4V090_9ACTN|nr:cytochrome c oxidase subunit 4 [Streptomyces scabichelini]NGO07401.1 cytochrome c oxidase subunit 4 [Streptomyces scabichelini]
MRTEARLFTGVAVFFAVTAVGYGWFSEEPAGTAVLAIAFLMAALVAFFLHVQYRRRGPRAQDRGDAQVVETAGPLEFLPPHSPWPITTAVGSVVVALGVVYGLWLLLLGLGVLAHGVFGMVFQYAGRADRAGPGRPGHPDRAGQGSNSPLRDGRSASTRSR